MAPPILKLGEGLDLDLYLVLRSKSEVPSINTVEGHR